MPRLLFHAGAWELAEHRRECVGPDEAPVPALMPDRRVRDVAGGNPGLRYGRELSPTGVAWRLPTIAGPELPVVI